MRVAALVAIAWTGCVDSSLVPCGTLDCPVGDVCTAGGCAAPADVAACDGMLDGAACKTFDGADGTCAYGACHTDLCGNGKLDPGEVCDGTLGVDPSKGQTCSADCKHIYMCGDGNPNEPGKQCDDGNANPADGCDMCALTTWNVSVLVGMEVAATATALANPSSVAFDDNGRLFVADTDNHRIVRVELDGSITIVAGTGTSGFAGDGGAATSALLAYPSGVAVDGLGRVFIADTGNNRIRRVEIDGSIDTIAGTGAAAYGGDGGPALFAQLSNPFGIWVDGQGFVYVADTGNQRVRRIDLDGTIETIAGNGTAGFAGDGGPATSAELSNPAGIAIDGAGRLVIADTVNQRVRRVDGSGRIATIAGTGATGDSGDGGPATAASLDVPVGIAIDGQGRIAIAELFGQRVRRIDGSGTITTVAGTGVLGFLGDGGAATSAELASPLGVAVDGLGRLAIADTANQRVREIASDGTISTIAGTGAFGFAGDGAPATSAQLSNPYGIAIDAQGRVVIADTFDQRVRRVELDGTIGTVAGSGTAGSSGDGGPAIAAELSRPAYVAIDLLGRIVVTDTYNERVRRVELDGTIHTIAGTGVAGFSGDGGPATSARVNNPNAIAIDGSGRAVFADTYNHVIRRIALDGTIATVAGNGTFGSAGDGGPATSAQLAYPYGVAIDGTGRILIGDTGNQRVRRVELDGTIHTIAGTGVAGFSGDGGPATLAQLSSPYGVAADAQGRVYIADSANQLVRRVDVAGTIATVVGTGVQGTDGDGGPALGAQLAYPYGVAIDPQGRLVVSDTNNGRVRRVELDGSIDTIAGKIDPDGVGPMAAARLVDPRAIVITPTLSLVAGGSSGTLEAIANGRVEVVGGRYPQNDATGALARFRTTAFGSIGGAAFDPATGLIYITETSANAVHVIAQVDPSNPARWTIVPLANRSGAAGFVDGAAASAQFRAPTGLYLDTAANVLYIADTGNHAIRALDRATNMVTTVVNTRGSLGFAGDGGPATAALLYEPTAITRCANGDLFVADTGNNRVRRVDATATISTVLGDGVPASSGEGTPARAFPVDAPRGLACDPFGNVFATSSTAVRLVTASDAHVVDGGGTVETIYGAPPRTAFPASVTSCLTGIAAPDATTIVVADACTGLLVDLSRVPAM